MTPIELLEEVKDRFTLLLADDDEFLEASLKRTLRTYQDKAGYVRATQYSEVIDGVLPYPKDYLQLVSIEDGVGGIVLCSLLEDGIHINPMPPIRGRRIGVRYPITINYLINFRSADLGNFVIPETAIGLMQDYLECLIQIQNVPRLHRNAISSKVDVSYLPDEATLYARKVELETDMASQKAIIRGASIYC